MERMDLKRDCTARYCDYPHCGFGRGLITPFRRWSLGHEVKLIPMKIMLYAGQVCNDGWVHFARIDEKSLLH